LYLQALEISQSQDSRVKQPEYAITLTNLANLYHDVGKFTEAGKRYEEALKLRREILSENHPIHLESYLQSIPLLNHEVPSEFSGTETNNFATRAFDGVDIKIEKIVKSAIKASI